MFFRIECRSNFAVTQIHQALSQIVFHLMDADSDLISW
jgi:hypothetical protein